MKTIKQILFNFTMILTLLLGYFYEIETLENIAITAYFIVCILLLVAVIMPSEALFKKHEDKPRYISYFIFLSNFTALAVTGWVFTSILYAVLSGMLIVKKIEHLENNQDEKDGEK